MYILPLDSFDHRYFKKWATWFVTWSNHGFCVEMIYLLKKLIINSYWFDVDDLIVIILDQEKGQGGMEKGQGGRSALSLY